jgi:uncharacterized protein (TIGR02217 family)
MSWLDIPFPPCIAFGIECDPEWQTVIATTAAGYESRNLNWSQARHSYDASFAIRTAADHQLVREHFHLARGRLHSWPLLDPTDHDCALEDGVVSEPEPGAFQLYKRYGSGAFAYDRKITRPFGVTIYLGSNVLGESDYALDETTGLVTIADSNADINSVGWSGQFYVPCRYDTQRLPVRLVNKGAGNEYLVSTDSVPIVEVRE